MITKFKLYFDYSENTRPFTRTRKMEDPKSIKPSSTNLERRIEEAKKECETKIKKPFNTIVLVEPFLLGDIIYVAAVTKLLIYKVHLYAIQYTPIASKSNFAAPLHINYQTLSQLGGEEFYKTELEEIQTETFRSEFDALQKFAEYQTQPPNVETKFAEEFNARSAILELGTKIWEGLRQISETTPRCQVIKKAKVYPPIVIRRGNESTWTHDEFEHMILFLCEANGIQCVQNRDFSNQSNVPDIWLKIPTNNVQKEISHQKALCMRIWGGDFLWVVKEHLYSEGFHVDKRVRIVKKTITTNGVRHEQEVQVVDEDKCEEVNFEHMFIGALYQAQMPHVPLVFVQREVTLEATVQELFQFFRKRDFTALFRSERSLFVQYFKHKMLSSANLETAQLDSVFPVGSIICPKLGKFFHPGAVYLGKGEVAHGPLWTIEGIYFRIESLEEFIGSITTLVEIRWRFNPLTPSEIIARARRYASSDLSLVPLANIDRYVFKCAMDLDEVSNLNDWAIPLFNEFRQRNFTEIFSKAAQCLVKIIEHDLRREQPKISDERLDQLFHFGSVLCAKRKMFGGLITPYEHAGVYLGNGTVIHAFPMDENEHKVPSQIFRVTDFSIFVGESTSVKEYRWRYSPLTRDEVRGRAQVMSEEKYLYDLKTHNCEHLAFQLAMGINFSPQMSSGFKSFGATAIRRFLTLAAPQPAPTAVAPATTSTITAITSSSSSSAPIPSEQNPSESKESEC